MSLTRYYRDHEVETRLEAIKRAWTKRTGDLESINRLLFFEDQIMEILARHKERLVVSPPFFKDESVEISTKFLKDQTDINYHHSVQQEKRLQEVLEWGSSKQRGNFPQVATKKMFEALKGELWYASATIWRDEQGNVIYFKA